MALRPRYNVLSFFLLVDLVLVWGCSATQIIDDGSSVDGRSYDFVVVGGGLAGLTVSNRLSDYGHSVLIIEAGSDASWNHVVYNAQDHVLHDPFCNWQYTAYDEDGEPLTVKVDSGACIGGSTSINGMLWNRPTKAEIDQLESLGNPGWNWNTLQPYMDAVERNISPDPTQIAQGAGVDPDVHGHNGQVNTSFPTPMRIPAAVELYKEALPLVFPGLVVTNDLSNRTSTVSASSSWTIWFDPSTGKNRRSSAADGFLWAPEQQRDYLTVLANHTVAKVIFDRNLTAREVEFVATHTDDTAIFRVAASRGVILSAGALASPAILERSGIGSSEILRGAGIEPLVELPGVGAHLSDQPGTGVSALVSEIYQVNFSIIDNGNLFAPIVSLVNADQIWKTDAKTVISPLDTPDVLAARANRLVVSGAAANADGAVAMLNATIDLITRWRLPVAEFIGESYPAVLTAIFWPLLPLSRGYVHINTSDPRAQPLIVPRFLTDEFDCQVAVAMVRRARATLASEVFNEIVANPYLDPPISENSTDSEYLAWLRASSYGASHWIGSSAMMAREFGGVVDPGLRVYGTRNMYLVDAGVIPFPITSHTMSTLYAIAGRAADLIHGQFKAEK